MGPRKNMPSKSNLGATRSLTTLVALSNLNYGKDFHVRIPGENELPTAHMEDELCFFVAQFKRGMELPIPDYLANIFNYFKMVPNQFTPNTFSVLRGLHKFFEEWNIEWSIPNILSLITFCKIDGCFYYSIPRHFRKFAIEGNPSANHGWRSDFVYVKSDIGWNIDIIPKMKNNTKIFHKVEMTKEIQAVYDNLDNTFFSLNVLDWNISTVLPPKVAEKIGGDDVEKKKDAPVESSKKRAPPPDSTTATPAKKRATEGKNYAEEKIDSEEDDTIPLSKRRHPRGLEKNKMVTESSPTESDTNIQGAGHNAREGEADEAYDPLISVSVGKRSEERAQGEAGASGAATEEGSINPSCQIWYNKDKQLCSFRFNNSIRFVPEQAISHVPLHISAPLTTEGDIKYLRSLSKADRIRLQGQLSTASSIVAKFISDDSDKILKSKEGLDRANKKLTACNIKVESELKKSQREVEDLKKKNALDELDYNKELSKWVEINVTDKTTIEKLQKEISRMNAAHLEEKNELKKHIFDLQRQIEDSSVVAPPAEDSKAKIIEEYKESEDFVDEMIGFGIHGFNLLKKYLVKAGHVDQAILDTFDYVVCAEMDAEKDDD